MELFSHNPNIDFLGKRRLWVTVSLIINCLSLVLWFSRGEEKYGVDFRGGTELVVRFNDDVSIHEVRQAFNKGGFSDVIVQGFESGARDFSIRLSQARGDATLSTNAGTPAAAAPPTPDAAASPAPAAPVKEPVKEKAQSEVNRETKTKIDSVLKELRPSGYQILKEDFVGPVIGAQIRRDGLIALFLSFGAMLAYIAFRFDWRFGLGAIFAICHDTLVVVFLCLLTQREMSAGILAALLTIVGYSMNDTVIVFDRIRENLLKFSKGATGKRTAASKASAQANQNMPMFDIMNLSVNETLSRTILTSLTAFFVVTTLYLLGGGAVVDLSFALMVGIVVGTYSSIFIACPIVLALQPKETGSSPRAGRTAKVEKPREASV